MTFLFDIGNVLLRFDYTEGLLALIPPHLGDAKERLRLLDEKKDDLESGRMSAEDFTHWSLATLGSPASPAEFVAAWRSIFTPITPTWELARKLAAEGHRLILFSNINAIHSPWIYHTYPIFSLFDGAVMSFEIGVMKPKPEFYQKAIDLYDLIPEQTAYIDDLPANCEMGKTFGFHCFTYQPENHANLEQWVDELIRS